MKKLLPLLILLLALTLPACEYIEDFGDPPTDTATGSSILETHPPVEAAPPTGDTLHISDDTIPILEGSVIEDPIAVPDVFPLGTSYEIIEADWRPGGRITVSTVIQNITDTAFTYEGSSSQASPVFVLYRMDDNADDARTIVLSQDYTADIVTHTIDPFASVRHTVTVDIPAELPGGEYILELKLDCGASGDILCCEHRFTV